MSLVCNATTPEEMRGEMVSLIRYRAAQERAVIGITSKAKRDAQAHEQAARQLDNLAADVERMEIVNAWPSGLKDVDKKSYDTSPIFYAGNAVKFSTAPKQVSVSYCKSCGEQVARGESYCAPCDPRE